MKGVGSISNAMLRGGLRFRGGTSIESADVARRRDDEVQWRVFGGRSEVDSLLRDDECVVVGREGVKAEAIANVIVKVDA